MKLKKLMNLLSLFYQHYPKGKTMDLIKKEKISSMLICPNKMDSLHFAIHDTQLKYLSAIK